MNHTCFRSKYVLCLVTPLFICYPRNTGRDILILCFCAQQQRLGSPQMCCQHVLGPEFLLLHVPKAPTAPVAVSLTSYAATPSLAALGMVKRPLTCLCGMCPFVCPQLRKSVCIRASVRMSVCRVVRPSGLCVSWRVQASGRALHAYLVFLHAVCVCKPVRVRCRLWV